MASKKSNNASKIRIEYGKSVGGAFSPSWVACDATDLHRFVSGAVRAGALVSFGRTRDNSAVVLTILHDDLEGGKYKDYFGSEESIQDVIEYMAGLWGDAE